MADEPQIRVKSYRIDEQNVQLEMREKPHERDQGAGCIPCCVSNLRVSNSKAIEVGANHGRPTSPFPDAFVHYEILQASSFENLRYKESVSWREWIRDRVVRVFLRFYLLLYISAPRTNDFSTSVDRFHPGISHQASRSWLVVASNARPPRNEFRALWVLAPLAPFVRDNKRTRRCRLQLGCQSKVARQSIGMEHGQLRSSFTRLGIVSISKGWKVSIVVMAERLLNNICDEMISFFLRPVDKIRL